jgi:hypothetical protein
VGGRGSGAEDDGQRAEGGGRRVMCGGGGGGGGGGGINHRTMGCHCPIIEGGSNPALADIIDKKIAMLERNW